MLWLLVPNVLAKKREREKNQWEEQILLKLCFSNCSLRTSAGPQTVTDPQLGAYIKMQINSIVEPTVGSSADFFWDFLNKRSIEQIHILKQALSFLMDLRTHSAEQLLWIALFVHYR